MAGEPVKSRVPARSPAYKRITQDQLRALFPLHRQGKTQTEIAQILGTSQQTISRWLTDLTDTRDDATAYLRSKALAMSQQVVRKGKPDVQLKALQGLGVIGDGEAGPKVIIQIGGQHVDVRLSPVQVSPPVVALTGETVEKS